ncbi:hypothetical protein D3C76_1672770 [compost metagenome]
MQAAHAALPASAGMVDLAHMKRRAHPTQATFAEQTRELPTRVFMAFVLQAEQPWQRQRLQMQFAHDNSAYRLI